MRAGEVLLQALPQETKEFKDFGETCLDAYAVYFIIFYFMEDGGLLNINSPIDLFALHLTYIPRINHALGEFLEGHHRQVRTANHWSLYQMWVNGMLNENNTLAHGQLDDDPDDLAVYGIDPAAPSPFEDSENNVVVPPVNLPGDNQLIQSYVEDRINPLMPSIEMGIDIYERIRHIINDNIGRL